jgi:hypothetical protein
MSATLICLLIEKVFTAGISVKSMAGGSKRNSLRWLSMTRFVVRSLRFVVYLMILYLRLYSVKIC